MNTTFSTFVKSLLQILFGVLLAMALLPVPMLAQESTWHELRTRDFAILYTEGNQATAQTYAGFVDTIFDETSAVFGHPVDTPLTLRLYPTWDSYVAVNPLARGLPGIVAHADYQRHEVVVVLSQTTQQTPTEVENNLRHEVTHIIASDLSENRLNVLFQEGIAQYVEHASPELDTRIQLLQRAFDGDQLMRWGDLDNRQTFYDNAEISYPQSLSIVAFLIEKYSFASFRDFLTVSAKSSGYRTALERAYSIPADQLETAWRAWLPEYLAGGYRRNAVTAYDLSRAEALLSAGRYTEAGNELESALTWLRTTNQHEVLAQAEALLERSTQGKRALQMASDARSALEAADYARAADLTAQAQRAYTALGDTAQDSVLSEYAVRAARGMQAHETLNTADALAAAFRYPQARAAADKALAEFAALGDQAGIASAQAIRATMDTYQTWLGAALLAFGFLGIAASFVRRLVVREAEAW